MKLTHAQIYAALLEKNNGDPNDPTNCYVDEETNTIWILAGEAKMKAFWSPTHIFKYMTDEELNAFLVEVLTPPL